MQTQFECKKHVFLASVGICAIWTEIFYGKVGTKCLQFDVRFVFLNKVLDFLNGSLQHSCPHNGVHCYSYSRFLQILPATHKKHNTVSDCITKSTIIQLHKLLI